MQTNPFKAIPAALRWTRASYCLMSAFAATLLLIVVVWWPLVVENIGLLDPARPWWKQMDWLLTRDRRRRSPCWRMAWRLSHSGAPGCWPNRCMAES